MSNPTIFTSWPIRKKLLFLLLLVFLPAFAVIITSGLEHRSHEIGDAKNNALVVVQSLAAQQEHFAIGTKQMLGTLAQLPEVQTLDAKACNEIFRELNKRHPFYSTISAVTPDGNLFAGSLPFEPGSVNLSDRKHIKDAIRTLDFSAGEHIVGRVSKIGSINFTYPVLDANHNLVAIVIAGLRLDEYAQVLKKANLPEGSIMSIADHRGVRLYRYPENEIAPPGEPIPAERFRRVSGNVDGGIFETKGRDGADRIFAFRQLRLDENSPPYLYMTVSIPKDTALSKANAEMIGNLFLLGIAASLVAALAWFFGNLVFIEPIHKLVGAVQRFGGGEMGTRTDLPHTPDELGQLAKSFDNMARLLEIRVDERTSELKAANDALRAEISERKKAEEALGRSEQRFRSLFERHRAIMMLIDPDSGEIVAVNDASVRFYGYSRDELCAMNIFEINQLPQQEVAAARRSIKAEDVSCFIFPHRIRGGEVRTVEVHSSPIDITGRTVLFSIVHDITERKHMQDALARAEEKYRGIFENAVEGLFQTTIDGRFLSVNPAMARIFGYDSPEDLLRSVTDIARQLYADPGKRSEILRLVERGVAVRGFEAQNVRKDGTTIWVTVNIHAVRDRSGKIIYLDGSIQDITERKTVEKEKTSLESRLRQAQKMEAIGTLAGGIAHDFNNILTAIIGFSEIARSRVPEGTPLCRNLDQILKAGTRAKDLVKQILTFSRKSEQERRPVPVTPIIKEALKLLRSSLPSTIEIQHTIETSPENPENSVVMADPTQIHQVLMNLCTNAAHAMRSKGGILTVGLSDFTADSSFVLKHPELKKGPHVCLTVGDTGHGMDAAIKDRIFDPYFTTKGPGEGTGLGLAVVQGIVKGHGGAIIVQSEPGRGTTFQTFLPRIGEEIATEIKAAEPLLTGSERILFVDDEKALADLGKEMLESLGYTTICKTSSVEALECFRANPDAFDLVITDMTMPGLTGGELARELVAIRPDIPVVLCTGFSDLINERQAKEAGIGEFVMKPYAISDLAKAIRKVLDRRVFM